MITSARNRAPNLAPLRILRIVVSTVLFVATAFVAHAAESANTNRVLRTVADVRKLSPEQASQKLPVRLNGVITYWGPRWMCFFSDDTGGIFLKVNLPEKRDPSEPAFGDQVEVTGVTSPGDFAPLVDQIVFR